MTNRRDIYYAFILYLAYNMSLAPTNLVQNMSVLGSMDRMFEVVTMLA